MFHAPGRGPDQLNRCKVAAESSLLTCSLLCSHISWYNTIWFLLPCGCSWIASWENSRLQEDVFQKIILLIIQYKYLRSYSGDCVLQNLILRTRSCGTGFINLVGVFFSMRPRWSGENVLYHSCTSAKGASRGCQLSNIFRRFIGAGGRNKQTKQTKNRCHDM